MIRALALTVAALLLCAALPALGEPGPPAGENAATPLGDPVLEAPTLRSLGAYWIISGDDNKNAVVSLEYRAAGAPAWKQAMPLFRVEKGANRLPTGESKVKVPANAWLFAGSAVLLNPDTAYELRLRLTDPNGGRSEQRLAARTIAEPVAPSGMRRHHVVPGTGGGSGTAADPFRGLTAAQANAQPGDLFLLGAGVYPGTFEITKSGQPGRPIIWRGAGDGEAILDGQATQGRAVSVTDVHDVWVEGLSVRNAEWGLVAHEATRVVVRACHFYQVNNGITATRNDQGRLKGLFISDNLLEGPFTWPPVQKGASVVEHRGIQISGSGQEVCYNRVRRFKDGIDTLPSPECTTIDIHNNEVSECLDDGCEMDGSERNARCYYNRLTDVFQGISTQPVHGGPVYVFRNAVYNIDVEPFKLHNSPSGALFFHNTCVKKGEPLLLSTIEPVHNCVSRNNLFVGSGSGRYAYECLPPTEGCDFDYDGFAGGPWGAFLKWNSVRYPTLADVIAGAPVYHHAVWVDPESVFASGLKPPAEWAQPHDSAATDLRLKAGTAAIDVGAVLPGFNDGFAGKAPDLGAYEVGSALPHYGPRPRPTE